MRGGGGGGGGKVETADSAVVKLTLCTLPAHAATPASHITTCSKVTSAMT